MKNSTKAWLCGCLPPTLLVLNLVLYSVLSFVGSTMVSSETSTSYTVFSIIRVFQGFFGVVFLLLIPVGGVLAIVFATKKEGVVPSPAAPKK